MVLSWDGSGGFTCSKQIAMEPKGLRDIVKITLEDGQTLKCTPDHKILTTKKVNNVNIYEWVEARNLKTIGKVSENGEWVINPEPANTLLLGPEFPEDISGTDEKDWRFNFFDGSNLNMEEERDKCLALSRLIGLILSDGCISYHKRDRHYESDVYLGHQLDVDSCLRDIILITGKSPKPQINEECYVVRIPSALAQKIALLDGMTIGRRARQEEKWPRFLLDCPMSILREFLCRIVFWRWSRSVFYPSQSQGSQI